MWASAQRDGSPAEYRWRLLLNATKFGWHPILDCRTVTLPRRKTRWNYLGCPKLTKRSQPLVGKFTILWGHVEEILLLNKCFPIVDTCLSCEDVARQSCAMVRDFLHPVFSAICVQHVSDLHPKFALRPHHEWKYGRHPICDGWD